MSRLRRYFSFGNVYFISAVTADRAPILLNHASLFKDALLKYSQTNAAIIFAYAILPDHFHLMIDSGNRDLSKFMQQVKLSFSKRYRQSTGHSGSVWQRRFWDHVIRNQTDFNNHIDYIHYNAVKHGYASSPFEWEHSSASGFLSRGLYAPDWGTIPIPGLNREYGE